MQRPAAVLVGMLLAVPAAAQTPARDPSATLEQVLPSDVAALVLVHIADARARQLPAAALEHRALELAAKGVRPADIERDVAAQEIAMAAAKQALEAGGRSHPDDDEVDAAGTVLQKGLDGAAVSALAKSAPSGRSLAVPLLVIASLTDRGLPSDEALEQVLARLQARASDQELQQLPGQSDQALTHRPALTGQALAGTNGSRVSGLVPPSPHGGGTVRPTTPARPSGHP